MLLRAKKIMLDLLSTATGFFFATSEIEWVNESLQQENAKVSASNVQKTHFKF